MPNDAPNLRKWAPLIYLVAWLITAALTWTFLSGMLSIVLLDWTGITEFEGGRILYAAMMAVFTYVMLVGYTES